MESLLGCMADCAECTQDGNGCTELAGDESPVSSFTSDRRRWTEQREAEYSGGASRYYRAQQGAFSATGRSAGGQVRRGWQVISSLLVVFFCPPPTDQATYWLAAVARVPRCGNHSRCRTPAFRGSWWRG